ncbi:MAG: HAD family hydrolase [Actinomycetes bacterium]
MTGLERRLPGEDGWRPDMVCLDIDGTICDIEGRETGRVQETVHRLTADGVHVVLATGRSLLGVTAFADELGLESGYAVCSNGAVTARLVGPGGAHEVVDAVRFDPSAAVRVLLELAPDTLVAVEQLGWGHLVNRPFPDGELMGEQRVVPLEAMIGEPATKVILRNPEATSEDFLALVERAGLHGVNYAIGYTAWLDLLPKGVSKASALEQVRERLDVAPDRTWAAGDGRNDVEMLDWAAWSVAMGHAPAEVAAHADEVVPPVEEDGVVQALQRWFP